MTELGPRLGPLLWQFAGHKKFDEADFGKFLELLPPSLNGVKLRHVVEPRHASFCTPAFIALLRKFSIPAVFAEHETYPAIPDPVGDFVYLRLQKGKDDIKTGYPPKALDQWAERAKAWAKGGVPKDLELIDAEDQGESRAARCVRVLHPRRQGARARRGDGADQAAGLTIPLSPPAGRGPGERPPHTQRLSVQLPLTLTLSP